MSFLGVLSSTLFATFWLSWLGLPFAALPAGIVAAIRRDAGSPWTIPAIGDENARKVPFLKLALLGGLGGEFSATASLFIGEWWICRTQHQLCFDGQGGIALIFTVPALSLFGGAFSLIWTWASLRIPARWPVASVLCYSGPIPVANWACAAAMQIAFWLPLTFLIYRLMFMP